MLLSEKQFRAVIESKLKLAINDDAFKILMRRVPIDEKGMIKYVEFMTKFDSRLVVTVTCNCSLITQVASLRT